MTYDPNDPNRMPGARDPYERPDMYGREYSGPHWGWFAGFFALLILGMIVFLGSDGDTTRTASKNPSTSAPATTGSAPSPVPITNNAPNRGGAER
jgi:hypothetical protein